MLYVLIILSGSAVTTTDFFTKSACEAAAETIRASAGYYKVSCFSKGVPFADMNSDAINKLMKPRNPQ